MNRIPNDIVNLIYKYLHYNNFNQVLKTLLNVTKNIENNLNYEKFLISDGGYSCIIDSEKVVLKKCEYCNDWLYHERGRKIYEPHCQTDFVLRWI